MDDDGYQQTKRIVKKEEVLKSEFEEFIEWINSTYEINAINLVYSYDENLKKARIDIWCEKQSDVNKITGPDRLYPQEAKEKQIKHGSKISSVKTDKISTICC